MKNFKIITLTLFFFALFATSAFAQVEDDTTVEVGATVDAALSVTTIQNLDFGNLSTSDENSSLLQDGESNVNQGDNFQLGEINVEALGGETISISVPTSVTLTDESESGDADNLNYVPLIFDGSDVIADGDIDSGEGNFEMGASGDQDFSVGGTLSRDGGGNFQQGIFSGNLTVTIRYDI